MIGIYMYENKINHKKYIGQSTNINRRKEEHIKCPSKYSAIDDALKELGEDNFIFRIIEECKVEDLDNKEVYWIKYYDSFNNGYNLTEGGQSYRGSSNPNAKLKEDDVRNIIDKLRDTKITISQLANEYGVHYNTISEINRCKTWNWLHNYSDNIREQSQGSLYAGELCPNSKINTNDALNIINLLKHDSRSMAQLARDESISLSIIQDINRCKTWKHLHNYKKNIRQESRLEAKAN